MNTWIVLLCAAVVCCAVVQCDHEKHRATHLECAKENNISEEQLKELKEQKKSPDFVPTESYKCLKKCVALKMGMIKDGKLDTEHIKEWAQKKEIDAAKVQAAIDECSPILKGDGSCDEAYRVSKCLMSHHDAIKH